MSRLTTIKTVLEIMLLLVFMVLLWHIWRSTGRENALALLTNKP